MNFAAFIIAKNAVYIPMSLTTQQNQLNYDTADAGKKAVSNYITVNKTVFQNGYTAYVIDRTTNKVVSLATIPEPTLEWKDQ